MSPTVVFTTFGLLICADGLGAETDAASCSQSITNRSLPPPELFPKAAGQCSIMLTTLSDDKHATMSLEYVQLPRK
jgi:hypothetical protein